ncbi:MAG: hypothetical protein COV76_06780, partial [Candidatus Omnitrophica bacterium CG11_big_fil_rev_8_21_14_0_20_64_10]
MAYLPYPELFMKKAGLPIQSIALILALGLGWPPSASALRPLNAGMEENPTRQALQGVLVRHSGLEADSPVVAAYREMLAPLVSSGVLKETEIQPHGEYRYSDTDPDFTLQIFLSPSGEMNLSVESYTDEGDFLFNLDEYLIRGTRKFGLSWWLGLRQSDAYRWSLDRHPERTASSRLYVTGLAIEGDRVVLTLDTDRYAEIVEATGSGGSLRFPADGGRTMTLEFRSLDGAGGGAVAARFSGKETVLLATAAERILAIEGAKSFAFPNEGGSLRRRLPLTGYRSDPGRLQRLLAGSASTSRDRHLTGDAGAIRITDPGGTGAPDLYYVDSIDVSTAGLETDEVEDLPAVRMQAGVPMVFSHPKHGDFQLTFNGRGLSANLLNFSFDGIVGYPLVIGRPALTNERQSGDWWRRLDEVARGLPSPDRFKPAAQLKGTPQRVQFKFDLEAPANNDRWLGRTVALFTPLDLDYALREDPERATEVVAGMAQLLTSSLITLNVADVDHHFGWVELDVDDPMEEYSFGHSAGLEGGGLKFGDPKVWADEESRTDEIFNAETIPLLQQRIQTHSEAYPKLFSSSVVNPKVAHIGSVWAGIQSDMAGSAGPTRVKDLRSVQPAAQESRFGKVIWRPELTGLSWKALPYNVAQALLYSEAAWATGFYDAPENPLTDLYKGERDARQEKDLWINDQPALPLWTRFVLGEHKFGELQQLSNSEKQAVLQRALLLILKGNALDLGMRSQLQIDAVGLSDLTQEGVIVDDSAPLLKDLTGNGIQEVVIFQDNVGVELIGVALFTAAYLRMYPGRHVVWGNKEVPYLIGDVVRRDIEGWKVSVSGVDGRSWLRRFQDRRYNPDGDPDVTVLFEFLNRQRTEGQRLRVLTHPWLESGFLGEAIPADLAQQIGGPHRILIAVGEWLNERFANGIPYGHGELRFAPYEQVWGYLRDLGIPNFGAVRMIKDDFIVVIPSGGYDGEIVPKSGQGTIGYFTSAGLEAFAAELLPAGQAARPVI